MKDIKVASNLSSNSPSVQDIFSTDMHHDIISVSKQILDAYMNSNTLNIKEKEKSQNNLRLGLYLISLVLSNESLSKQAHQEGLGLSILRSVTLNKLSLENRDIGVECLSIIFTAAPSLTRYFKESESIVYVSNLSTQQPYHYQYYQSYFSVIASSMSYHSIANLLMEANDQILNILIEKLSSFQNHPQILGSLLLVRTFVF